MKQTLTQNAYAKINLYLAVVGKRPDGYHKIESVMQTVSLADIVTLTLDTDGYDKEIALTCSDPTVPTDRRNIAVKCAEAFLEKVGMKSYSLSIRIEKNIPVSGGLAGGSTDGAAVLRMLNQLLSTPLSETELYALSTSIGADIPFCLLGRTALCEGIGEKLTPLDCQKPDYHVLIVSPGGGVSTPEAYHLIDEKGQTEPPFSAHTVIKELVAGQLPHALYNEFESVILPLADKAALVREKILSLGADVAQMSGSGPTLFGLFRDGEICHCACEELKKSGYSAVICQPR